MESKAGTKIKRPEDLSLPNENTLIINIICGYFKRYGKCSIKFNKKNGQEQSKKRKILPLRKA